MSLSKTPTDSCTGGPSFTYFHVTVPDLACKVGEGVHNLEYLPATDTVVVGRVESSRSWSRHLFHPCTTRWATLRMVRRSAQ